MLSDKGQNIHNYELPKLGEVGVLVGGYDWLKRPLYLGGKRRKCIVHSFPLCDNEYPFSLGIHTVNVRYLDNNEIGRVSGFYFQEIGG